MIYIGIDPGKSGGIAWISDGEIMTRSMPDTLKDLWDRIEDISMWDRSINLDRRPCVAYLEQVHSMPGQGVKSSFTFGNGFGHLEMALTGNLIPFVRVTPQKWQRAMGCMTKGDKNVSKRRAQELFPSIKVTHAIADAMLIAEYGRTKGL